LIFLHNRKSNKSNDKENANARKKPTLIFFQGRFSKKAFRVESLFVFQRSKRIFCRFQAHPSRD